jgi:hypothetical protein
MEPEDIAREMDEISVVEVATDPSGDYSIERLSDGSTIYNSIDTSVVIGSDGQVIEHIRGRLSGYSEQCMAADTAAELGYPGSTKRMMTDEEMLRLQSILEK